MTSNPNSPNGPERPTLPRTARASSGVAITDDVMPNRGSGGIAARPASGAHLPGSGRRGVSGASPIDSSHSSQTVAAESVGPHPIASPACAATPGAVRPVADPFTGDRRPATGSSHLSGAAAVTAPGARLSREGTSPSYERTREHSSTFNTLPLTPAPSGLVESEGSWSRGSEPSASFDLGGREPSSQMAARMAARRGWSSSSQASAHGVQSPGSNPAFLSAATISAPAILDPTVHPHDADAQQAMAALFAREPISEIEMAQLVALLTRESSRSGRVLTKKGQPAQTAFILANGFARLEMAPDQHPLGAAALRVGDVAGDAAVTGDEYHHSNVVTASDVVLFSCDRNDLLNLSQRMPVLAARLAMAVAEQSLRRSRLQTAKMTQIANSALGLATLPAEQGEVSSISRLFTKLTGRGGGA